MASLSYRVKGALASGEVATASKVILSLNSSDHVHTKVEMDPESSLAKIVLVDDDDSRVEILCGVRQMTPTLREIVKAFEQRLAELPDE